MNNTKYKWFDKYSNFKNMYVKKRHKTYEKKIIIKCNVFIYVT